MRRSCICWRVWLVLWPAVMFAAVVQAAEPTIYTPKRRPRVFPAQNDFTIPLGTAQLFLPYIETPADLPLDDYRLVVELPNALQFVALDSMAGVAGHVVKQTRRGDRRIVEIAIDNPFGVGMELSACWTDATPATIAYVPELRAGGTCSWRRLSARVRSPASAVLCKPLLIKWQRRGLSGTAWFDDLVVHEAGSRENLLREGTFEEPYWDEHADRHRVLIERDEQSTHAARISGKAEQADRQDALWVGPGFAVKPDTDYVFEATVKCDAVRSTTSRCRAALLLRLDDPAFSGGEIRFGFRAHGGQVVEATQSIPVRVLPRLLGKRPREARIVPCYYGDVVGLETSAAIAENIRHSGVTGLFGRDGNRVAQLIQRDGGTICWAFPYNSWQLSPTPDWTQSHPDRLAVNFQGRSDRSRICPTYALEQGSEFAPLLEAWVRHRVAATHYSEIDIDYEVPVVEPPRFCFCQRCLDAFRAETGLPAEEPLDAKNVVAKYRRQWTDFRCRQNALLIGKLAGWIREADSTMYVSVYSGYQSPRTREHYGVDWSLLAPHLDSGIAGYGGSPAAMAKTRKALGHTPLMGGEMYYLSFNTAVRGPIGRDGWKMRLLRCFVHSGCHGVLIWWLPVLDGQAYFETSQAAAVIHDFENFLRSGKRADKRLHIAGDWPAEDYAVFPADHRLLLLLFNPGTKERKTGKITVDHCHSIRAQRYDDVRGELGKIQMVPESVSVAAKDVQVWLLMPESTPSGK